MKRILVYSKNGQMAQSMLETSALYGFETISFGRPKVAIDDFGGLLHEIEKFKPDILVNASAYNQVDQAEKEPEIAHLVNAIGPQLMARACSIANLPFIHISTDYVFDGTKDTPYIESDLTNPLNVYGASKKSGEDLIMLETQNYVILRTSWVFSKYAVNFPKNILEMVKSGKTNFDMVYDQFASPTSANDLVRYVFLVANSLIENPRQTDLRGLFHATSQDGVSRYDFAKYFLSQFEKLGFPKCTLNPVSKSSFNALAQRPDYSILDSKKLSQQYGIELGEWREEIDKLMPILAKQ